MVTVATALQAIGYEIEVFSLEDGPVHGVWREIGFPFNIMATDENLMAFLRCAISHLIEKQRTSRSRSHVENQVCKIRKFNWMEQPSPVQSSSDGTYTEDGKFVIEEEELEG